MARIWRCRDFWLSLVRMDLRNRYRRSVLGMGWSFLHPIAMMVILCIVFHNVFHAKINEYAPFLLTGLACWNYLVSVIMQGCQSFFLNESYIRQYPAPLAIYPLRTALTGTVHFLIALLLALLLTWGLNGFANLAALASLVPAVLLLFVFLWSLALLAGFATVYFQDTQHITEVVFQIGFYATPIIYKPQTLRDNHLDWLLNANPLYPFVQLIREPIVDGRVAAPATFALAATVTALAVCAAVFTVVRLHRELVFRL
jgi:ABC-type polysaccharide/polyol phosphate export permease